MKFWNRARGLLARHRLERQMAEEMQAHIDALAERHVAAGMSAEEARYAARRAFGGVEQIKERVRDEWSFAWAECFWRDLRFSVRSLRRSPTFSLAVIVTLALCIGVNATILTVLYDLVVKPLPLPDAGQVVTVSNLRPTEDQPHQKASIAQYLDYREHADLFDGFALSEGWMFNFQEAEGITRYVGAQVTHEYFSVLGLQPLKGRFFRAEEGQPGQDKVAVLTESFWRSHFNSDPAIVGKEVWLSGVPHTIIGVAPRRFEALNTAPLLLKPLTWTPPQAQRRLAGMAMMIARIKPGVAHPVALAQLQTLEDHYREQMTDTAMREYLSRSGHRMDLSPWRENQVMDIRDGLFLLQAGALLVLVLGCVNVASLMLARANARGPELTVRQALGASRGVLARQLLIEAAVLAMIGGMAGLGLALASLGLINAHLGTIIYGLPPVALDGGAMALTLGLTLAVALMTGLSPVAWIWRAQAAPVAIQGGIRGAAREGGIRTASDVLVVTQVALALVLLIGAGLLLRSFARVMAINPGFDVDQVFHVRVAYNNSNSTADVATLESLQNRLLGKMREIPGVESVAYSWYQPGHATLQPIRLPIRGQPVRPGEGYPTAIALGVSPEYFATMGMRLLEGRNFTPADALLDVRGAVRDARIVYIVDREFAERHFGGRSPVGQRFGLERDGEDPAKAPLIIGMVETARVAGLEDHRPYVYGPMFVSRGGVSMLFRTQRSLEELLPQIRLHVREVDPALAVYGAKAFRDQLDDAAANRRGVLWLLGAYAGLSLLLAAVGIYGMLAYDVTQRTGEIGVRGAIGASRRQIVMLFLREGLAKAGLGLLLGLGGGYYLSRYLATALFEVKPTDPLVFAGVTVLLLLVALLASWLPARQAAKVDPIVALRAE